VLWKADTLCTNKKIVIAHTNAAIRPRTHASRRRRTCLHSLCDGKGKEESGGKAERKSLYRRQAVNNHVPRFCRPSS
jgi:hypothetical protein